MIEVCNVCGAEDFFSHRYKHWGWPNLDLLNDKENVFGAFCDAEDGDVLRAFIKIKSKDQL